MAVKTAGFTTANILEVEANKAARTCVLPRGTGYAINATTGTMAAALTANAAFFAMRSNPSGDIACFIDRIRLQFTTIVAFTTPVTATRRIVLTRGTITGVALAAGTQITTIAKKSSLDADDSRCQPSIGGDCRISTTGALTTTGVTYEGADIAAALLIHAGAAGGFADVIWEFSESAPLILQPGELIAIRNGVNNMDAAGTWVGNVQVQWREAVNP